MTPSALTPAARGSTKKSRPDAPSRPSSPRGAGHRSNVRRSVAPTAPRRVSGPAGGVASGGVIAVPAPVRTRPTRERTAPTRAPKPPSRERKAPTRERTAPSRSRSVRSRRKARSAAGTPWRLRTAGYVRALPDHILLDRIVRGRVWIPLLGLLLAGIVAMQVEVLKLNAGIGRSLERGSALQARNELLRASVSQLSDDQRIERLAAQLGMLMPAPDQLRFATTAQNTAQRAVSDIHTPNATDFLAALPTIGAPAAAQGTAVNTDVGLTPTAAATSSTPTAVSTSSTPTSSTDTTSSDATSSDASAPTTTSPGTTSQDTTPAGVTSTPESTVTPAAPTTVAGTSDQSAASGGVGATASGG